MFSSTTRARNGIHPQTILSGNNDGLNNNENIINTSNNSNRRRRIINDNHQNAVSTNDEDFSDTNSSSQSSALYGMNEELCTGAASTITASAAAITPTISFSSSSSNAIVTSNTTTNSSIPNCTTTIRNRKMERQCQELKNNQMLEFKIGWSETSYRNRDDYIALYRALQQNTSITSITVGWGLPCFVLKKFLKYLATATANHHKALPNLESLSLVGLSCIPMSILQKLVGHPKLKILELINVTVILDDSSSGSSSSSISRTTTKTTTTASRQSRENSDDGSMDHAATSTKTINNFTRLSGGANGNKNSTKNIKNILLHNRLSIRKKMSLLLSRSSSSTTAKLQNQTKSTKNKMETINPTIFEIFNKTKNPILKILPFISPSVKVFKLVGCNFDDINDVQALCEWSQSHRYPTTTTTSTSAATTSTSPKSPFTLAADCRQQSSVCCCNTFKKRRASSSRDTIKKFSGQRRGKHSHIHNHHHHNHNLQPPGDSSIIMNDSLSVLEELSLDGSINLPPDALEYLCKHLCCRRLDLTSCQIDDRHIVAITNGLLSKNKNDDDNNNGNDDCCSNSSSYIEELIMPQNYRIGQCPMTIFEPFAQICCRKLRCWNISYCFLTMEQVHKVLQICANSTSTSSTATDATDARPCTLQSLYMEGIPHQEYLLDGNILEDLLRQNKSLKVLALYNNPDYYNGSALGEFQQDNHDDNIPNSQARRLRPSSYQHLHSFVERGLVSNYTLQEFHFFNSNIVSNSSNDDDYYDEQGQGRRQPQHRQRGLLGQPYYGGTEGGRGENLTDLEQLYLNMNHAGRSCLQTYYNNTNFTSHLHQKQQHDPSLPSSLTYNGVVLAQVLSRASHLPEVLYKLLQDNANMLAIQ